MGELPYILQLKFDLQWEAKFGELLKYYELYGTIIVPNRPYNLDAPLWERRLASWCSNQRQNFKKGRLKQWRYDKLMNAGFIFDPFEDRFDRHFADFLKFKEKYGHTLVPQDYNEIPGLGSWVQHLRTKSVTGERKARLNAEGFVWNPGDEQWQNMFRALISFNKKFGHLIVSERNMEYRKLGSWTKLMRRAKRNGKGFNLTDEQIKLLDSIGFAWVPVEAKWERNMKKLLLFISQFGHCNVSIRRCNIEGLGWWVNWIRINKHKLSAEKIAGLDALGFEWDSEVSYRKRNNIKPGQK